MAYATLTFGAPINTSCQVGDIAYYVTVTTQDGFDTGFTDDGTSNGIVKIGDIREISNPTTSTPTILVETTLGFDELNLSSPLGYYASVKLINNSKTEAEMFSVSMEAYDSSK